MLASAAQRLMPCIICASLVSLASCRLRPHVADAWKRMTHCVPLCLELCTSFCKIPGDGSVPHKVPALALQLSGNTSPDGNKQYHSSRRRLKTSSNVSVCFGFKKLGGVYLLASRRTALWIWSPVLPLFCSFWSSSPRAGFVACKSIWKLQWPAVMTHASCQHTLSLAPSDCSTTLLV